ncbi:MAG: hypothetical protein K6G83_05500 [Lachnospiraceae bacterium]|nr:hypothetical protein [Lachnospiraceae bacterium]
MRFVKNSFPEFQQQTQNKKLIIFAASEFLFLIERNFKELRLAEKAAYIVDNSLEKQGSVVLLGDREIEICSPERLWREPAERTVILIASTAYAWEIFKQLESNENSQEMSCFFLMDLISSHSDDDGRDPFGQTEHPEEKIPRKIHCFWFGGGEKDPLSKRCLNSWEKSCPDYEIIEWNADNYDISKHPYMEKAFEMKKWAFASDYARLDILDQYGGFYFDLDVELYRTIDPLRMHDFVIGFGPYRDVEAAAFGAKAGCSFVKELLKIYQGRDFDWERVLAGEIQPVYLNKEFQRLGFLMNGRYQEHEGVALYPKELFSDRDPFTEEIRKSESAFGVHHCAGGWWTEEGRRKHKMAKEAMVHIRELYEGAE